MSEKVTLAQRLRAIASDVEHGAQEGPARMLRQVADVLDQETDALEEVAAAAHEHLENQNGLATIFSRTGLRLEAALDHLHDVRRQR